MILKNLNLAIICICCAAITQISTISLHSEHERVEHKTSLDIKNQQQQQQLYENHLSSRDEQRHHKSYDKINDVVMVVSQQEQQQNLPHAIIASDARTATTRTTQGNSIKHETRQKRELSDWLIAPNTKWCGRGNMANGTYNDLGGASAADKCCRKHDHCRLFIPGMSKRYQLFNYRPYTLSHCQCDRRFRTCLKMANDEDAITIGKLFFNMVQTQCFRLRRHKICLRRAGDGTCERYEIKQKAYLEDNKKF